MTVAARLQPDQRPELWNHHVSVYEAVFEPLTDAFARRALDRLGLRAGDRLLDVAAGSGGAALLAAARGVEVVAVDASPAMVARIRERAAAAATGRVRAELGDGMALALPDASFDAAISVFGVVLFADAARGLREMRRTLRPGGRAAVVTWTEPERYELVARLIDAVASVRGPPPAPPAPPAQLRFREEAAFRALFAEAGLRVVEVTRVEEYLSAPSARWLGQRIGFAPGMAAMMESLGTDRERVMEAFVAALERDRGAGEVALPAVAFVGTGEKPS
jgi:ubiquinone/menaquinone biosynthesis C-methylase UbiE